MTRITSTKNDLKLGLTVLLYELKQRRTLLIVYSIIAAFLTTVILSLSVVTNQYDTNRYGFESVYGAAYEPVNGLQSFHVLAAAAVFLLTSIFTIIYTMRIFSYLHNKRKADRINPMPIPSGVLFIGKALAAFAASVIPALFFIGIICLITVFSGATVNSEVVSLFWQIPMGSIACISFYGLMAVCCGGTANTVLSFLGICFAYPVSAFIIKGMIEAFFFGVPNDIYGQHFLLKALNPLAAYDGVNIIYWVIFTLCCFALSVWLLRRRKAEHAQTSFAFRLPCYVVEILITFIAGMLLGIMFGSYAVLGSAFAGFVFGMILGGGTAFVVCHIILFRGFNSILKSLIGFGAVTVLAIAFTGFCCLTSDNYALYMPSADDIVSVGYINFGDGSLYDKSVGDISHLINDSAEDFKEESEINSVYNAHQKIVDGFEKCETKTKFQSVTPFSFRSLLYSLIGESSRYSIAYKLKDGRTVTRFYDSDKLLNLSLDSYYEYNDYSYYYDYYYDVFPIEKLEDTKTYAQKYSAVGRTTAEDLASIEVSINNSMYRISEPKDIEKLFEAFKKDYLENGKSEAMGYSLSLNTKDANLGSDAAISVLLSNISNNMHGSMYNDYGISNNYKNTYDVLEEIGIVDKDKFANKKSPYLVYANEYDNEDYYGSYGNYDNIKYSKNEEYNSRSGMFVLPWDCIEKYDNNMMVGLYNKDDELLAFESYSKTNMATDTAGTDDKNMYASDFQVTKVLTRSAITENDCMSGTAKVKADGKEETLRFVNFSLNGYTSSVYFFTDKVTDDEIQEIIKSFKSGDMMYGY